MHVCTANISFFQQIYFFPDREKGNKVILRINNVTQEKGAGKLERQQSILAS